MWNKIRDFFRSKTKNSNDPGDQVVFVWAVVDGPIEDDLNFWTLVVKVAVEGELIITELHFSSFEEANSFSKLVVTSPSAIKLSVPSDLDIAESERECQKQQ